MPRESYNVRTLRSKALASFRNGVGAFNSMDDLGRTTMVLLSLQHSFEMLLKAALESLKEPVFDKRADKSISLETSVRYCQQHPSIKLTEDEAGTIRALDALRDAEQHWHVIVDEGILYLYVRAAVTLFDDLLRRVFDLRLADQLPSRVLPISAEPPQSLELLVDREYERIAQLLKPGRRTSGAAKARIRALLATEVLANPESADVREADVQRVSRDIRHQKDRSQVFPILSSYSADVSGAGLTLEVRLVKSGGLPVTYSNDPDTETAVIKSVSFEKKFYMGANALADRAGVSRNKAVALRRHYGLDLDDDHYSHVFEFDKTKRMRYSDNALKVMKQAKDELDIDRVWAAHRKVNGMEVSRKCDQPGCVT